MSEFINDMVALLINFGTVQFMPFLGWLSQRVLFILAQLDVEDVVIIGVILFGCCSLLDRIRRHSFFDNRPYGIPYWVINFLWGVAALTLFLALTDSFVWIAFNIRGWVATRVAPELRLAVVLMGAAIAVYILSDRPAFRPLHFVRLVLVRFLPLGLPYGFSGFTK